MVLILLDLYHNVNKFLGTFSGELVKTLGEVLVLFLLTYMLSSEYIREKEDQYKYLLYAIVSLLIGRIFTAGILGAVVYTDLPESFFSVHYYIIASFLEILGIILIVNAFMYPTLRKKLFIYKKAIKLEIFMLCLSLVVIYAFYFLFRKDLLNIELIMKGLMEIGVITSILFLLMLLITHPVVKDKFTKSMIAAFLIYIITPVIVLLNIIFFRLENPFLVVASHPFPMLAIILLTRAIYLRLVDKAMLKDKLTETTLKYEETKEISKLKDEFISTVSHELKTPLTAIKLYLSLFETKKLNEKDKEKAIVTMKDNADHLNALINDVLDLSKLEAKKVKLKPKKINLLEHVKNSTHDILAKTKGINVNLKIPEDKIVFIDEEKFKHIIINLFSNAVKFTEEGGKITIGFKEKSKSWELFVKDTGKGIPKDKIPFLFDKFYQVEEYLTREKKGTGLGLAIVKKLVELHDGEVLVSSSLGQGSTFRIIIPNELS